MVHRVADQVQQRFAHRVKDVAVALELGAGQHHADLPAGAQRRVPGDPRNRLPDGADRLCPGRADGVAQSGTDLLELARAAGQGDVLARGGQPAQRVAYG